MANHSRNYWHLRRAIMSPAADQYGGGAEEDNGDSVEITGTKTHDQVLEEQRELAKWVPSLTVVNNHSVFPLLLGIADVSCP